MESESKEHLKALMIQKLPHFDPKWSEGIARMWFALFDKMWQAAEVQRKEDEIQQEGGTDERTD